MERSSQRVIHAYAHVRTNQVLYSFTPYLHNATVARQFPDTGANTSFTKLRKDLWRPLWTVSFPEGEHADAQGRHAFKKLREWRKLHETSWDPPAMLAMNHSEKEIKKLQDALDERGGSKKENVYDVIKHKKKKMRVAAVLDQRANSVADLAAVLAAQEALGSETQKSKAAEARHRQEYFVQVALDLAKEAENGGIAEIEARLDELKSAKAKADRLGEPMEMSKTQMRREQRELTTLMNKMQRSIKLVGEAAQKVKETHGNLSIEQQEDRIRDVLSTLEVSPSLPKSTTNSSIPKRGSLRARIERANAPVFSTEGIVIKWANQLDAEYAEAWPQTINHQAMGFARHRAPAADEEAIYDVAGFRSKQTEAYNAKRGVGASEETADAELTHEQRSQKEGLNKVRGEILGMVKAAVAKRRAAVAAQQAKGEPTPAAVES